MGINKIAQKVAEWLGESTNKSAPKVDHKQVNSLLKLNCASFSAILPYRYFDQDKELFMNENSIGFGFEISVFAGVDEKIINSLSDLLRYKLKEEYDIQFVLWGNNQVGELIDQAFVPQIEKGGIYRQLARDSSNYYHKAAISKFKNRRNLPLTLRDYRCFCFVAKKTKYNADAEMEIISLRTDLEAEFKSNGIGYLKLNVISFLNILRAWINPNIYNTYSKSDRYNPHETLNNELVDSSFEMLANPDELTVRLQASNVVEDKEQIEQIENKIINLSLKNLPDKFALWQVADNFFNILRSTQAIQCPFLISVSARLIPQSQAKMNAQRNYLSYDRKSHSPYAKYISGTTDTAAEWKKIRDELSADEIKLTKTYFNIVLFSNKKDQKRDESSAVACYRYNNIEVFNTKYMQLQSFLATFPFLMSEGLYFDLERMGRLRTVTTWNLANLLPIVADPKVGNSGLLLPTFRNQIAFFDQFDESLGISNHNIAVAATSGAGKSFLIQALIMQVLANNGKCWVIDIGHSYKKFCQTIGGTYLSYENLRLNPFTHITNITESCEKIRDLFAVLASPRGALTDVQKSHLLDAVNYAWNEKGNAAKIDDVIAYLEGQHQSKEDMRVDDIATLLKKYSTQGINAKIFNEYSALAPDAEFVVLELGDMKDKPDLMKAVLFALILAVEEQMYSSPRNLKKMCVIDEAWQLLNGDNKEAAEFIEKGFRTARRHRGSFVTITQGVNDYHESTEAEAAWNNSESKIIMRQNSKAFQDFVAKKPDFYSKYEQALIKNFGAAQDNGFSEFMLQIGNCSSFHRLFVDPFSRIMFSSSGSEFEAVEQLCKQGVPIEQAISQVAQQKYRDEF